MFMNPHGSRQFYWSRPIRFWLDSVTCQIAGQPGAKWSMKAHLGSTGSHLEHAPNSGMLPWWPQKSQKGSRNTHGFLTQTCHHIIPTTLHGQSKLKRQPKLEDQGLQGYQTESMDREKPLIKLRSLMPSI